MNVGELVEKKYEVCTTSKDISFVKITTQGIDLDGRNVGEFTTQKVSIKDVEQLVGFCLRCGNKELLRAVRRPVFRLTHGPNHPFANQ